MSNRMRAVDDAVRRARRALLEVGDELREARLASGVRQADVGRALGWSASKVARIEHGVDLSLSVPDLARIGAVIGRDLSVRLYPGRGRLRDAAQLDLEKRFLPRVEPGNWRQVFEEALNLPGDLRAFDLTLRGVVSIGVEFVTRIRDVQALVRQASQKQRDSGVDRVGGRSSALQRVTVTENFGARLPSGSLNLQRVVLSGSEALVLRH